MHALLYAIPVSRCPTFQSFSKIDRFQVLVNFEQVHRLTQYDLEPGIDNIPAITLMLTMGEYTPLSFLTIGHVLKKLTLYYS